MRSLLITYSFTLFRYRLWLFQNYNPIQGLTKGAAYRLNSHVEWVTRCNRVLTIHEWYTAGQGFENYAQLLRSRHSKS